MNNLSELERQAKAVCDKSHDLLGCPIQQLEGIVEAEKIVIEVPKGLTYLSGYLSMLSQNTGQPVSCWGHHEQALLLKYKGQRMAMRRFIEHIITDKLHEELHLLSTFRHQFLEQQNTSGEQL